MPFLYLDRVDERFDSDAGNAADDAADGQPPMMLVVAERRRADAALLPRRGREALLRVHGARHHFEWHLLIHFDAGVS